jgi:hypothetical protein
MVDRESISFVFSTEYACDQFEGWSVVVGEWDSAQLVSAGEAAVDDGLSDGVGGEQAAMQEFGVQQVEAVGEGVDVGDDAERGAVLRPVPAA